MVNIKDIVDGHIKELFNINEEISKSRLEICYKCPIYSPELGGTCNSKLWIKPNTQDISTYEKPGYIKGCGCRLKAKSRIPQTVCIAGKW